MARALVLLLVLAFPATADSLAGVARVIDGDTLQIGEVRVRLVGIDAPETHQTCQDDSGGAYRCGVKAAELLRAAIGGAAIICTGAAHDRFRRLLAVCQLGEVDLNRWMVSAGWALAYRKYSTVYVDAEDAARLHRRGLWAGSFTPPWAWRQR